MSTTTLDRREFLRVTAAGASGLLLGVSLPGFGAEPSSGAFEPNAWIGIDASGAVTITVAKQEMGQGVLTSLSMIVAEELEADWSKVRAVQADAHPTKYGSQGTGGSSSVRGSYDRLRSAGAAAREMLVAAAAKRWNVPPASCSAKNGVVRHAASGRSLSYGQLAADAAQIPVPEQPALKDPKDFAIIGTRRRKLDTPSKTNGTARYGIDTRIPGMVFAAIARPPVFGATVASFNASDAKKVAGVLDAVQTEDGIVVTARNSWSAIQGARQVAVRWNESPWAGQSSEAIWKSFEEKASTPGTVDRSTGDAASALTSAARVVEAVYRAPLLAHATMEPMNCTVSLSPDGCEVWAPTQTPQRAQNEAARILGVNPEKVVVHVTQLGGGFGRRLQADYVAEAVRAAKAVGRPLQVVWSREDDMTHDFYRPNTYNVLKAGLDGQGNPVAWTHRIVGPNNRGLVVAGSWPPYAVPGVSVDFHLVETGVPIGAWRSVGASQNTWVIESFIDELAHAARKDPVAYRLGLLNDQPRHARVLTEAARLAGWSQRLPAGRARGVAVGEDFGTLVAEVAEISVTGTRVSVHKVVAVVDCGPYVNPDTIEAQVQGAIVMALTAALKGEVTVKDGRVEQTNFDSYPLLRIDEMPVIEVHLLKSDAPMGGIGEPGLPPAAPAVCNAIFAATGKRVRRLPVRLD